MKKYALLPILAAFVVLPLAATFAQGNGANNRPDTVLLSVYNTGNKYRLTPATFSAATSRTALLTDMVWVLDTVVSFNILYSRRCGIVKISITTNLRHIRRNNRIRFGVV